ncbi:hypothetical protein M0805_005601 [Coniferiporia weirii]|nr:hypothetical protein M0805_005601 [Coniferiporia weirii]
MGFDVVEVKQTPSATLPDFIGRVIDGGHLRLLRVIGRGSWGVVYCAETTCEMRHRYAVKCVSHASLNQGQLRTIQQEVEMHERCAYASPSVLNVHRVIEVPAEQLLFIVTEFCPDGDLLDGIIAGAYIGQDELIRHVFLQIIDAVDACHRIGVFHRDLKPENVMCKDGGRSVVLGDFGFATTRRHTMDFRLGSEPFMSPELRGGIDVQLKCFSSPHADIWALGVILMNLVTGSMPWSRASVNDPHFAEYLYRDHDYLYNYFPITRAANELLKSIFTVDPNVRTTLAELRARVSSIRAFSRTSEQEEAEEALGAAATFGVDFIEDFDYGDLDAEDSETEIDFQQALRIVNHVVSIDSNDSALLDSVEHTYVFNRATRSAALGPHRADPTPVPAPIQIPSPLTSPFMFVLPEPASARADGGQEETWLPLEYEASDSGSGLDFSRFLEDSEDSDLVFDPETIANTNANAVVATRVEKESDSDAESEGPITPETHAADDAVVRDGVATEATTVEAPAIMLENLAELEALDLGDTDFDLTLGAGMGLGLGIDYGVDFNAGAGKGGQPFGKHHDEVHEEATPLPKRARPFSPVARAIRVLKRTEVA